MLVKPLAGVPGAFGVELIFSGREMFESEPTVFLRERGLNPLCSLGWRKFKAGAGEVFSSYSAYYLAADAEGSMLRLSVCQQRQ
jgi:hypothetical protein